MTSELKLANVARFTSHIVKQSSDMLSHALNSPDDIDGFSAQFAQLYSDMICFAECSTSYPGVNLPTSRCDSAIGNINRLLTQLYGSRYASLSQGGSSGAMLTLMTAVLPKLHPKRKVVLFDEYSHQSLIGGLIFSRVQAVKIKRRFFEDHGTASPIQLSDIKSAVRAIGADNIAACVIVNPSYDGFRDHAQERAIYVYLKDNNITVVNDGAWGPMAFTGNASGAGLLNKCSDICITSLHKRGLTPSSTGCVLTDCDQIARLWDMALDLGFRSTSPSFVNALVTEHRLIQILNGEWDEIFKRIEQGAAEFRNRICEIHSEVYIVTPAMVGADYVDPAHILISTSSLDIDARSWAQLLSAEYNIFIEKATKSNLLLLIGSPLSQEELDYTLHAMHSSLMEILQTPSKKLLKEQING